MDLLAAPYVAAALLLVVAGVAKALDPVPLARALSLAGLPARGPLLTPFVRVGAVAEAVVGGAAVVAPSAVTAGLVSASYLGFSVFVLRALRSGSPLASCGCFGSVDTPPTVTHVVTTGALATVAAVVVARPDGLVLTLPLLAVIGVLAYGVYLLLAVLPLVSPRAVR